MLFRSLVGSNAARSEPFANIDWSTSEVMAQTRTALAKAHLSWAETDALWDVDTADDVLRAERNSFLLYAPFHIGRPVFFP